MIIVRETSLTDSGIVVPIVIGNVSVSWTILVSLFPSIAPLLVVARPTAPSKGISRPAGAATSPSDESPVGAESEGSTPICVSGPSLLLPPRPPKVWVPHEGHQTFGAHLRKIYKS